MLPHLADLLAQAVALLVEDVTLRRQELQLRRAEHAALRRRGWGPGDRMSIAQAAAWLGVGEGRAEVYLQRRGILRVWDVDGGDNVRGVLVEDLADACVDGDIRPVPAELDPTDRRAIRPSVQPRRVRRPGSPQRKAS